MSVEVPVSGHAAAFEYLAGMAATALALTRKSGARAPDIDPPGLAATLTSAAHVTRTRLVLPELARAAARLSTDSR